MGGIRLGEDLETEILSRLPAKSLMRFKCVQRSWNVLFRTPTFVTRHMQMHVSDERSHMILHDEKHQRYNPCITRLSGDDPTTTRTLKFPFPYCYPSVARIFSYGHCRGVFCLKGSHCGSHGVLILWNPSTREVHLIPPPPFPYCNLRHAAVGSLCGFGADPNTKDFKVVNLYVCYNDRMDTSAEIYNLSTKSWTVIHRPVLPPPIILPRLWPSKYNPLVNDVYHWITGYSRDGVSNILCFDFRNNLFHNLRAPTSRRVTTRFVWDDVAELKGSLAYVAEYDRPVRLGIWVMDQGGWAEKYNVGPFENIVRIRGIWKDGAQVLGGKDRQPLTSYDHDGNPVR